MAQQNRTKLALKNSATSTIATVLQILVTYISRTFFIYYLGKEYLGINGLFTSVLSFLSLVELGIGPTITYSLYKPLAKKQWGTVKSLMRLYQKTYRIIAVLVFILGISFLPFMKFFIDQAMSIPMFRIQMIYGLFLLNSVSSYFFTYNRSLLMADQKNYINTSYTLIANIVISILQVGILVLTKSFMYYLVVAIIVNFVFNIIISKRVHTMYSIVWNSDLVPINTKEISEMKHLTVGNVANKVGTIIVKSSDNLIIARFVSVTAVGVYSNYVMILNSLQMVINSAITSVTSGLGNAAVEESVAKNRELFYLHNFVNNSLVYFSGIIFAACINPFISIWVGSSYQVSRLTLTVIVINYFIQGFRGTPLVFISSHGLAWKQRWKPIVESVTNIVFSFLFIKFTDLQVAGVLLGTICSSLLTVSWYEPYLVVTKELGDRFRNYLVQMFYLLSAILVNFGLLALIEVNVSFSSYLLLIWRLGVSSALSLVIFLLFFSRTKEFSKLIKILKIPEYAKKIQRFYGKEMI
ncbi:lipopolysaccharide biosynthesis protein [Enterococcus sp. CSURQ0835]|uniref:lipopolysaccharide biosynthesis protein n=1 Tax=Enterococcus sp. CSURQ0835 TaxID=2681394 RepID=UPI001357BFE3|nr:oligosaccharide flippase family protein [Enterococcus sp. CSURQ0835]